MSRIAVALMVAAWLTLAPGFALGDEEPESKGQASAVQSEEAQSCASSGKAASSRKVSYCPAQSETLEDQDLPIYVPPGRGSPHARVGGASRGSAFRVSGS
jgi:hypothetical protein